MARTKAQTTRARQLRRTFDHALTLGATHLQVALAAASESPDRAEFVALARQELVRAENTFADLHDALEPLTPRERAIEERVRRALTNLHTVADAMRHHAQRGVS